MRISDWSSDVCSSDLRDHFLGLELLLGGQRDELVGGLQSLEVADRSLGLGDETRKLAAVDLDVLQHLRLHQHGMSQRVPRMLPAPPGVTGELVSMHRRGVVLRLEQTEPASNHDV